MSECGATPQFFTIGVYGTTADAFFDALVSAGIDTFCDIRQRRGVRGSEYAFVNAQRLQNELADRSIAYVHSIELAPTKELRTQQYEADSKQKLAKRARTELSPEFVEAYTRDRLAGFDSRVFVAGLGQEPKRVVLFCVEREPAACHRSIVAQRLEEDLGVTVTHLMP